MAHKIVVTIQPDGSFKSKVVGIKGEGCGKVSKILDEAGTVLTDSKTPEFYERETAKTSTRTEA